MTGALWVPRADQAPVMAFLRPRARAALWAPTGAGKTVMAATWAWEKLFDEFAAERCLIVAPKLVARDGWPDQFARWAHLREMDEEWRHVGFDELDMTTMDEVVASAPGRRHKPYQVPRGLVYGPGLETKRVLSFRNKRETKQRLLDLRERIHLTSWDAFPWIEEALGRAFPYDMVIFDEASFLRERSSTRSKAARRAVHKSGRVTHVLQLAATPNSNKDEAAFCQIDVLAPGALGSSLTDFRDSFCTPDSKNWSTGQVYSWRVTNAARPQFEAICAQHAVSVPDSLGIDVLPVEHRLELPPAARQQYDDLKRDLVLAVPRVTCGSEAVLHLKLRQIASGFVYDDTGAAHGMHDEKLARLREILDSLDGRQALIVFEFDEELARIKALLGKDFADIRKGKAKADFVAGKLRYLGIHPKSAGHGVDGLQTATNVIVWHTVPEDRELFDQTNGRLKRPGQDEPTVMAHMLIAQGTVEQRVWEEVLPAKLARSEKLLVAARAQDSQTVVHSPDVR